MAPLSAATVLLALGLLLLAAPLITHRFIRGWQRGGDPSTLISLPSDYAFDGEENFEPTIGAGLTDVQLDLAFTTAALKAIFIVSDKDVLLETNDGTTPDDTINLKANVPLVWTHDCYLANPFTVDVTAFFFTNAGAEDAVVKIRTISDSTP